MCDSPNLDGRNNEVNSSVPQQINGSKVTVLGEKNLYCERNHEHTGVFLKRTKRPLDIYF